MKEKLRKVGSTLLFVTDKIIRPFITGVVALAAPGFVAKFWFGLLTEKKQDPILQDITPQVAVYTSFLIASGLTSIFVCIYDAHRKQQIEKMTQGIKDLEDIHNYVIFQNTLQNIELDKINNYLGVATNFLSKNKGELDICTKKWVVSTFFFSCYNLIDNFSFPIVCGLLIHSIIATFDSTPSLKWLTFAVSACYVVRETPVFVYQKYQELKSVNNSYATMEKLISDTRAMVVDLKMERKINSLASFLRLPKLPSLPQEFEEKVDFPVDENTGLLLNP